MWVVCGLVAATALAAALVAGMAASSHPTAKGGSFTALKAGGESIGDKAGIANEGPNGTPEAEQAAQRAYPAESVPFSATLNSVATFNAFKKHGKKVGAWTSIGPNKAQYPALLDQFLAGGKPYAASGRVTALAVAGCKNDKKCDLYLGAAGGGRLEDGSRLRRR